jgi:hypothetical protein
MSLRALAIASLSCALVASAGCGARTDVGVSHRDAAGTDGGPSDGGRDTGIDAPPPMDANIDMGLDMGTDVGTDVGVDTSPDRGCIALPDGCSATESCSSPADDDCDGHVDEGCPCMPGDVQTCFPGPPGRRGVGACTDGTQTCEMSMTWGECMGGIGPRAAVCDGRDNLCDGCSAMRDCPISCPSPGDPRVTDGQPFTPYPLDGRMFYPGLARSWSWSISGGPCDALAPNLHSYTLDGATSQTPTFTPRLSGDYTITMNVVTVEGTMLSCEWVVHVIGPGLRVEMCYPESTTQDLDLFLHRPGSTARWYPIGATAQQPTTEACSWANCEGTLRGGAGYPRADWGYARSPLSSCINGPHAADWMTLGYCANPRLDIDNNLSDAESTGVPENINIDDPGDGQTFRVMVQNWSGTLAHPVVNVYCSGHRIATYGAAPDQVAMYAGRVGSMSVGAMWRVADITTHVAADGTLTCDTMLVHPAGSTTAYDVTYDDGRF